MKIKLLLLAAAVFCMSACAVASGVTYNGLESGDIMQEESGIAATPYITSCATYSFLTSPQKQLPLTASVVLYAPDYTPKTQTAQLDETIEPEPIPELTPEPAPESMPEPTSEPTPQPTRTPFPELPEDEKPMIALTFDDGPSRNVTTQILALLEKYNARATFCVIGYELEKRMDIGTMIYDAGSEIVSHTWSHEYLTRISEDEIRRQLTDTNALIEQITGVAPLFFRPPYGDVNDTVRSVSEELGLSLLMWSIDPRDWKNKEDTASSYAVIIDNVKPGCIILCHDIYDSTLTLTEMVLAELSRSFRFVTVSELFANTEMVPGNIYRSLK